MTTVDTDGATTTGEAPPAAVPPDEPSTSQLVVDGQGDDQDHGGNREAAKYRKRLRETEAERDRLATQVEAFRRGEVERMVGDALGDPADLWVGGVTLDELVDDDGVIDAEEVTAAVARVVAAHPSWAPRFPDLGQGARGAPTPTVSWAEALSPHGRKDGRP